MFRGYYTAASGIVTQEKKLNVYAHNLANISKTGYKKDNLISGTFGEHIAQRMDAYQNAQTSDIGPGVYMQTPTAEYIDYTQGGMEETNRPMDMAIMGDGYFLISDANGDPFLTRDGQFSLDAEGALILPGIGRVQGESGDIIIGVSNFSVDPKGNILATLPDEDEQVEIGRLLIVAPGEDAVIKKAQNGLFAIEDDNFDQITDEVESRIMQGQLERSNVNAAEEMTRIMASQRGLQSCSQIVKMYDLMAEQSNTRISKVQ